MPHLTRNAFLRKIAGAAFLLSLRPEDMLAGTGHPTGKTATPTPLPAPGPPAFADTAATTAPTVVNAGSSIDFTNGIIDLHCHPTLKAYLLNRKMWRRHHPGSGPDLTRSQVDLHQLRSGYVRGIMATHYLVEASIETEWYTLKKFWGFLSRVLHPIAVKIENEDESNVSQILAMMDLLQHQIEICNAKQKDIELFIAKNYDQFAAALDPENPTSPRRIPIAHAIEGAHALGRNLPISQRRIEDREQQVKTAKTLQLTGPTSRLHRMTPENDLNNAQSYLDNLQCLFDKGVCMMTLSHFFRNDISYPVDGVSPDEKKLPGMHWQYTPDKDHGLTKIGEEVVKKMLEIGMIIDLNHTTPQVRKDVFAITRDVNRTRIREGKSKRPLVFTHTGAQKIFEYYDQNHYPYYKFYCVSDEEIAMIEECNGVIGVIPENFWLVGADTHLKKEFYPPQFRYGIPYIIETMKYINSVTNNQQFDHIGIGTDFDGLADAPKDLYVHGRLRDLFKAMRKDPDITGNHIKKIQFQNAKRLLQLGWGA